MATLTVPRTLGGTLILTIVPPQIPVPTLQVTATFRDGAQPATYRDGKQEATHRDGNTTPGGR